MKKYSYAEAKKIIDPICKAADLGKYHSRESLMAELNRHEALAVQGYNSYGKIFLWNDVSVGVYGHSEVGAINKDLVELILPPEMQQLARDMIATALRTGKMPDPSPCDLIRSDGEFIAIYSGHIVFDWDDTPTKEFYCVDLPLEEETPKP